MVLAHAMSGRCKTESQMEAMKLSLWQTSCSLPDHQGLDPAAQKWFFLPVLYPRDWKIAVLLLYSSVFQRVAQAESRKGIDYVN